MSGYAAMCRVPDGWERVTDIHMGPDDDPSTVLFRHVDGTEIEVNDRGVFIDAEPAINLIAMIFLAQMEYQRAKDGAK